MRATKAIKLRRGAVECIWISPNILSNWKHIFELPPSQVRKVARALPLFWAIICRTLCCNSALLLRQRFHILFSAAPPQLLLLVRKRDSRTQLNLKISSQHRRRRPRCSWRKGARHAPHVVISWEVNFSARRRRGHQQKPALLYRHVGRRNKIIIIIHNLERDKGV